MTYSRRRYAFSRVTAISVLVCASAIANAQVTVTPTVTFDGALYLYNYSIFNGTGTDLAAVTLEGIPSGQNSVQNLLAPIGFFANYDTGLGLVDFLADTDTFAPGTTVSGFQFSSPFGPGSGSFSALDNNGVLTTGATVVANTPEPGAMALLAGAGVVGALSLRRRRTSDSARKDYKGGNE